MDQNEITYEALVGSNVTEVIDIMISEAEYRSATLKTEFNGVTIRVRGNSDPALIYRDWSRAMSGKTSKNVGPYPWPTLSPEVLAEDARIEAENERRRQEAQARYEAEAAAKTAATEARLAVAPPMDVADEAAWQSLKDQNGDPYGSAVVRYAEMWARLMQAEMAGGAELEDVADATSSAADIEGVTGYMHGAAVHSLAHCWVHGDRLRKWHNRQWGVSDDREGTVNPAILTFTPEG